MIQRQNAAEIGLEAAMRLVVIGGDAAGGSTAANAKRGDPSIDVVMFERGPWTSYSA